MDRHQPGGHGPLTPFVDKTAAGKAGFDTSKPYHFKPFTPKLPEPLGGF